MTVAAAGNSPPVRSYWSITWRRFRTHRLGMVGLCVVAVLFLVAFLSPILANEQPILCRFDGGFYYPAVVDLIHQVPGASLIIQKQRPYRLATFDFKREFDPERGDWALWTPVRYGPREIAAEPLAGPSSRHWLGTDQSGRDVLSRMVHGTVVSMKVGFLSMGIAVILGLVLGCIAGYAGGAADLVISRFIEVVMCFPPFFLILAVLAWFPPSIENVMIVIGLTRWVGIARFARGEILRIRETDYALAARSLGVKPAQLVLRHLLPNALAPVLVSVTFGIAVSILIEAGLSWLGFGVQPPDASWGTILRSGYENLFTAGHMIPPACVAIFLAVLSFNLVGDTLRDVIDPRLQAERA
ncbi:MAG: ABC transporter permease [Holophagales bacterium]|nr:ABC transporter permease [Holophagales bacterium]MXX61147.1 ABC transporter permease [Holophagales bacterium]MYI33586.1 ABC transporter permease [Holophagales bacterium]